MNDMRKRFFGVAATSLFTMVLLPLIVLGLAVGVVNNHAPAGDRPAMHGRFALYPNGSAA
ncbi:MAG: hypothetical protein ACLUI3_03385 [Christensenellales bacterium]